MGSSYFRSARHAPAVLFIKSLDPNGLCRGWNRTADCPNRFFESIFLLFGFCEERRPFYRLWSSWRQSSEKQITQKHRVANHTKFAWFSVFTTGATGPGYSSVGADGGRACTEYHVVRVVM